MIFKTWTEIRVKFKYSTVLKTKLKDLRMPFDKWNAKQSRRKFEFVCDICIKFHDMLCKFYSHIFETIYSFGIHYNKCKSKASLLLKNRFEDPSKEIGSKTQKISTRRPKFKNIDSKTHDRSFENGPTVGLRSESIFWVFDPRFTCTIFEKMNNFVCLLQ